ncbi:patatin-like phospholipase family protein [Sorangium sp. So ce1151]|uniref:patatin-like phospholipase family protein n=1 Tax=Sorangium sp. So ce1151 TaxID=3133332 RepID=UPI003F6127A0
MSNEEHQKHYRILSVDGGGLYGLVSAIWLRQLCEENEDFLKPNSAGSVNLFAGTSAGAVSVLLLAQEENPRKAVLSGVLERFWTEPIGAFSNSLNPVAALLSYFGIGGWVGEQDFMYQLNQYFKPNLKLGDLKHNVLICAFNWSGDKKIQFDPWPYNPAAPYPHPASSAASGPAIAAQHSSPYRARFDPYTWAASQLSGPRPGPVPSGGTGHWRPKIFTNVEGDTDREFRVVDVAYAAATPAGIRAVRGGIVDGAVYSPNPTMEAIAAAVHLGRHGHSSWKCTPASQSPAVEENQASSQVPRKGAPNKDVLTKPGGAFLDLIRVLSVGNGSIVPRYWLSNFNFSLAQISRLPTNPLTGFFYPPTVEGMFDGVIEAVDYISKQMLGDQYLRLDPEIMPTPVIVATILARHDFWRNAFIQQIYAMTDHSRSHEDFKRATKFLSNGWKREPPPHDHPPK